MLEVRGAGVVHVLGDGIGHPVAGILAQGQQLGFRVLIFMAGADAGIEGDVHGKSRPFYLSTYRQDANKNTTPRGGVSARSGVWQCWRSTHREYTTPRQGQRPVERKGYVPAVADGVWNPQGYVCHWEMPVLSAVRSDPCGIVGLGVGIIRSCHKRFLFSEGLDSGGVEKRGWVDDPMGSGFCRGRWSRWMQEKTDARASGRQSGFWMRRPWGVLTVS